MGSVKSDELRNGVSVLVAGESSRERLVYATISRSVLRTESPIASRVVRVSRKRSEHPGPAGTLDILLQHKIFCRVEHLDRRILETVGTD